jgi:hypothetical protein
MSMTKSTSPTAIQTRNPYSEGQAEVICATPDEIETATVRI